MKITLVGKTTGINQFEDTSIDEMVIAIAKINYQYMNNDIELLTHYLVNQDWSIFESCSLTFECLTSIAVCHELIKTRELSPYIANIQINGIKDIEAVRLREEGSDQPVKPLLTDLINNVLINGDFVVNETLDDVLFTYREAIAKGVSRESISPILPLACQTHYYLSGTLKAWIALLKRESLFTTPKESREAIALIREAFVQECPLISQVLQCQN